MESNHQRRQRRKRGLSGTTTTTADPQPLRVVVVEPHHHALEEIHKVLRQDRRLLLGQSWSLCHIDAHPDLACPSNGIPAAACFRPRDEWTIPVNCGGDVGSGDTESGESHKACLYELLDSSTTGMSEWILPLVLAAGLNRVEWIKPADAHVSERGMVTAQIPMGFHKFHVGAVEPTTETTGPKSSYMDLTPQATVRVDWDCLYYRDDDEIDFYASHETLQLSQPLELHVLEWNASDGYHSMEDMKEPWILDICLDYFYCINPFLQPIQSLDEELARVSLDLVKISKVYNNESSSGGTVGADRDGLLHFRQCLKHCLQTMADHVEVSSSRPLSSILTEMTDQLEPFIHGKSSQVHALLKRWKSLFTVHRKSKQKQILTEVLDSIPHALLPHSHFANSEELEEYVSKSLSDFEAGLKKRLERTVQPPFLVTIARSMLDGFTPIALADRLQEKVISILHKLLCDNPQTGVRLQVVLQYEKDK